MGVRESKPYTLSYEEAVKRVSDGELNRLKSAYKRTATNGGVISCHAFSREVLGETVPHQLAQQIFVACGGSSKGIAFKDLLCSLVLLTKGDTEEKIKFIFSVYGNDTGSHVLRSDFQRRLQATEGPEASRQIIHQCLGQNDRLSYDEFREWLLLNPDATSITRWLLCSTGSPAPTPAPDTPTFYQRLAGVTHLEESEILELEKCYWTIKGSSASGLLDLAVLAPLLAPPLTPSLARGLFAAFDENRDGHIDFKEMACGISAACRGPQTERQKFLFKMFDRDRDGFLSRDELEGMVGALLALSLEEGDAEGVVMGVAEERVASVVEAVLREHDPGGQGGLTLQDYLIWTLGNTLTLTLLTTIFQVCHIVLGLRPNCPREEGEIVRGWLQRAQTKALTVGHFWYIVNMEWWTSWEEFVLGQSDVCGSPASIGSSSGSRTASLRRTKLQKKAAQDTGSVAMDQDNGVTVRSVSSLSTLSLDDALSVGFNDREPSNCWSGARGSFSSLSAAQQLQQQVTNSTLAVSEQLSLNYTTSQQHRKPDFYLQDYSNDGEDPVAVFESSPRISTGVGTSNSEINTHSNHQRVATAVSASNVNLQPACNGAAVYCNGGLTNIEASDSASTGGTSRPRTTTSLLQLQAHGLESTRSTPCSSPAPSPMLPRRGGTSRRYCRPPAIDNSSLVEPVLTQHKPLQLTWEGGRLRRDPSLVPDRDFVLLPEPLWKTLHRWYSGAPALPRQVIHGPEVGSVELELYPVTLHIHRHAPPRSPSSASVGGAATHWMGVMGGYGVAAISRIADSAPSYVSGLAGNFGSAGGGSSSGGRRHLAHVAAFSRLATLRQLYQFLGNKLRLHTDDMRLWLITEDGLVLLEECAQETLGGAGVTDLSDVLLEVRNRDLTWPEEMSQITTTTTSSAPTQNAPIRQNSIKTGTIERGVTGLNNLGNTCFLNAAVQCCSNTAILTTYFLRNLHLFELNPNNPCGTRGHVAREYGSLLHQIWGGDARSVAPLKLRWTIGKWSGNFTGADQHDSQELLAFLLDGLHEDLNRVQHKPYTELKDSEGRPDTLVAQEAWENHIVRNKSIIVDLFHGQLKSKVSCNACGHQSARFDPFTYLSLQLPMESYTHLEVILVRLDGSVPHKYGLRLIEDSRYQDIKAHLQAVTGIPAQHLLLADLSHLPPQIKYVPVDECRIRTSSGSLLYAYELPAPLPPSQPTTTQRSPARPTRGTGASSVVDFIKQSRQQNVDPSTDPDDRAKEQQRQQWQLRQGLERVQEQEPLQRDSRSAKDRQTLAQIQRATSASQHHTLQVTCDGSESGERQRSISPSPEPPPLHNDSLSLTSNGGIPAASQSSPPSPSPPPPAIHSEADLAKTNKGFLIAYHRKLIRQEVYFLSSQQCRPSLFGLPLVVPCGPGTSHKALYQSVWTQVSRLVTPLPPSEGTNHAADCDDSLGYEFPFVLCMVVREGVQCAVCPWYRFCRGCHLPCDDDLFPAHTVSFLAIDWDLTALHLRYQSTLEKSVVEDSSVQEQRQRHTEPISLQHCLEAFTAQETLEYSCQHCKDLQPATKKLQIWRLPPILIVHLKRFQFVGQKWIKSQKIVQFPLRNFDPTEYLASVPRETLLLHRAQQEGRVGNTRADLSQYCSLPVLPENQIDIGNHARPGDGNSPRDLANSLPPLLPLDVPLHSDTDDEADDDVIITTSVSNAFDRPKPKRRVRNGSVLYGDALQDFHQHRLLEGHDSLSLTYDLYAIACHSGVMEAGHYVCYAKNARGKWICFNDSTCREVSEQELDLSSAYLLFYERRGLDPSQYLPSPAGRNPHPEALLDPEAEAELRKQCSLM